MKKGTRPWSRLSSKRSLGEGFVQSEQSRLFREKYYGNATDAEWNDWRWQLRKSVRTLKEAERVLPGGLEAREREAAQTAAKRGFLPMALSPYYCSLLLESRGAGGGLRSTVIPTVAEQTILPHEIADPLAEDQHSPTPGLVHRYPDRVLFLVTRVCASYCRFCTRSRLVGSTDDVYKMTPSHWQAAIAYINSHPEVRDVLLSGGDPLMLSDESLDSLLGQLAAIPHVEFLRIGTKIPVALPQRITPSLLEILRRHRPIWMSINVTSVDEITDESVQALDRLADAGVPLGSQTVLLRNVNDSVEAMRELNHALLQCRVRPYYLYQLDPVAGTSHFQVPVSRGLEILEGLRGHTTGYSVPTYVIDTPGGKIPITNNYMLGKDGNDIKLRNFEGKTFRYTENTT